MEKINLSKEDIFFLMKSAFDLGIKLCDCDYSIFNEDDELYKDNIKDLEKLFNEYKKRVLE